MKDLLIKRLKEIDIIDRHPVRLKHGGNSAFYVDIKKAYGDPLALRLMNEAFWEILDKDITCIAASGYGGIPLGAVVAASHYVPFTLVREEPKEHGRTGSIEGYVPTARDKVAILDDVCSTGESLRSTYDVVRATGAEVLGLYVVVLRGKSVLPVKALLQLEELQ